MSSGFYSFLSLTNALRRRRTHIMSHGKGSAEVVAYNRVNAANTVRYRARKTLGMPSRPMGGMRSKQKADDDGDSAGVEGEDQDQEDGEPESGQTRSKMR